jgi:hypothetical protein
MTTPTIATAARHDEADFQQRQRAKEWLYRHGCSSEPEREGHPCTECGAFIPAGRGVGIYYQKRDYYYHVACFANAPEVLRR